MPTRPRSIIRHVVTAVLLVVVAAGCGRLDGEAGVHAHNTVVLLSAREPVSQTFTPRAPHVARVDLLLATYGRPVSGELQVTLRDAGSGRVLARTTLEGEELADNRWAAARFAPAPPAPQTARIDLRWSGTGSLGVYANLLPADVDPTEVQRGQRLPNDPYPHGTALVAGAPATGDLAFAVQSATPRQVLGVLIAAAGRAGRGLARTWVFTLAWAALLSAAAATAVVAARRATPAARARPARATRGGSSRR